MIPINECAIIVSCCSSFPYQARHSIPCSASGFLPYGLMALTASCHGLYDSTEQLKRNDKWRPKTCLEWFPHIRCTTTQSIFPPSAPLVRECKKDLVFSSPCEKTALRKVGAKSISRPLAMCAAQLVGVHVQKPSVKQHQSCAKLKKEATVSGIKQYVSQIRE